MGYETKVYFVEADVLTGDQFVKDTGKWYELYGGSYHYGADGDTRTLIDCSRVEVCSRSFCRFVASVELGKTRFDTTDMSEATQYFYADDGNTPVIEDRYGDKLKQCSLLHFISMVEGSDLRKEKTALAVAKSMLEGYRDVQVLFYGH